MTTTAPLTIRSASTPAARRHAPAHHTAEPDRSFDTVLERHSPSTDRSSGGDRRVDREPSDDPSSTTASRAARRRVDREPSDDPSSTTASRAARRRVDREPSDEPSSSTSSRAERSDDDAAAAATADDPGTAPPGATPTPTVWTAATPAVPAPHAVAVASSASAGGAPPHTTPPGRSSSMPPAGTPADLVGEATGIGQIGPDATATEAPDAVSVGTTTAAVQAGPAVDPVEPMTSPTTDIGGAVAEPPAVGGPTAAAIAAVADGSTEAPPDVTPAEAADDAPPAEAPAATLGAAETAAADAPADPDGAVRWLDPAGPRTAGSHVTGRTVRPPDVAAQPAAREHVAAGAADRSLLARAELHRTSARPLEVGITTTDLGRVRVTAAEGADGVQLQLSSDRPDGRARLGEHIHELRQDLDDRGVGLGSLEVSTGDTRPDVGSHTDAEAVPSGGAAVVVAPPTDVAPRPRRVVPLHLDGLDLRL